MSLIHCSDCAPEFDCWSDIDKCRKQPLLPPSQMLAETHSKLQNELIRLQERAKRIHEAERLKKKIAKHRKKILKAEAKLARLEGVTSE